MITPDQESEGLDGCTERAESDAAAWQGTEGAMAGWHSKTLAGSVQRIEQRLENVMSEISDANDKLTQLETQMQANRDLLVELHQLATNALPGGRILAQDVVDLTSRMDTDLTALSADDTTSAAPATPPATPPADQPPATPAA